MLIRGVPNVNRRHTEIHVVEQLPNGKIMHLWFTRYPETSGYPFLQWQVALYLADNRKEAVQWFNGSDTKPISTGDGTITGLLTALRYIMTFVDHLKANEELIVEGLDERRTEAYARLMKYGFHVYWDDHGHRAYGVRNLKYWDSIGGMYR